MPALSPTMTEGTLAKWLKSEGDKISSGDIIAEIETDKATMEVEAVDDGILAKIIVPAGTQNVAVNNIIAILAEEGEDTSSISLADKTTVSKQPQKMIAEEANIEQKTSSSDYKITNSNSSERVFASPLARRLAKEAGIDLSKIKGSGPHGRIIKEDLKKIEKSNLQKQTTSISKTPATVDENVQYNIYGMAYKAQPNNNIRKVVAKRLSESKQTVPHFYLTIECILDNLLNARKELNDKAGGAFKLSVNDFIIKAAAMALKSYPAANVSWTDDAVLQYLKADISVAVSTPNGLITPIVKSAEDKGLKAISNEVKDLATRARDGKLKPEEFQGGSFTVSNLGMYGVKEFAAIINPPQGCILAIGAGEEQAVVINGKIEIKTVMRCTLSVDHRCVDGAVGAEYLQIFKQYIENPVSMLV